MENIWCIQVWNREMNLVCSSTQLQQRTSDRQLLAFRICQICLTHQSVLKTLNVCQILAHWQFAAIQNSFLRQAESCWVLSDRNPPGQQGWASVLFYKSFSNLKKCHFHLCLAVAPAGQSSQSTKMGHPQNFGCWDTGTCFRVRDLNLPKQKQKPRCALDARLGCAGLCSGSGSELGWAWSSELLCKTQISVPEPNFSWAPGQVFREAHALSPSLNPKTLQSLSTSF